MELLVYFILLTVLSLFFFFFGRAFIMGGPYVPTDKKTLRTMISLLQIRQGERACDIGAGDGRIVMALAQAGANAVGYERNPFLVFAGNLWIRKNGLSTTAKLRHKNLWKADYREFTAITLFGIPYIMNRLEKKLLAELPHGTRVASNAFSFPNWKPVIKQSGVYLYVKE